MINIDNEKDFNTIINTPTDELVNLFENQGYGPDVCNKEGMTPLLHAVLASSVAIENNDITYLVKNIGDKELYERINILAKYTISLIDFDNFVSSYVIKNKKNLFLNLAKIAGELYLPKYLNIENLKKYEADNPGKIGNEKDKNLLFDLLIPGVRWQKERFYYLISLGQDIHFKNTAYKNVLYGNYDFEVIKFLIESGVDMKNPERNNINFLYNKIIKNKYNDSFLEEIEYVLEKAPEQLDFLVNMTEYKKDNAYSNPFSNLHIDDFKYIYTNLIVKNVTQEDKEVLALNGFSHAAFLIKSAVANWEKLKFLIENHIDLNEIVDSRTNKRLYHVLFESISAGKNVDIIYNVLDLISLHDLHDIKKMYMAEDCGVSFKHVFYELSQIVEFEYLRKILSVSDIQMICSVEENRYNIILTYPNDIMMTDFLIKDKPEIIDHLKNAQTEDGYTVYHLIKNIESYKYYSNHLNIPEPDDLLEYYKEVDEDLFILIEREKLQKKIYAEGKGMKKRI